MLREWRLSQFKSVGVGQRLEFRPFTVLAGANSSGKSSVIQSLLLMSQTVTSKVVRRHLVLNGELAKLGTFDDVLNERATNNEIGLGFTLETEMSGRRFSAPYSRAYYSYSRLEGTTATISVDLSFGPSSENQEEKTTKTGRLQADVLRGAFDLRLKQGSAADSVIEAASDDGPEFAISRAQDQEIQQIAATIQTSDDLRMRPVEADDLRYKPVLTPRARKSIRTYRRHFSEQEPQALDFVGVRLQHFLPVSLVDRTLLWPLILSNLSDQLSDLGQEAAMEFLSRLAAEDGTSSMRATIARVVLRLIASNPQYLDELRRRPRTRPGSAEARSEMQRQIDELLGASATSKTLQYSALPEDMDLLSAATIEFFSSVRYLGPLRDDPKPVYGISNSADPADVGPKGQYTAAVLDLYASRDIEFYAPQEGYPTRRSLQEWVRLWMNHFAMADAVVTVEEGKLGHRLLIQPGGVRRELDLTNVGVGVSQVLPLVVMSLISERGSLLLFEQPELHLHPAVQSLLADFFIAVAKSGRQCVVETHSEYLINRMRLRVAQSTPGDALQDSMMIHFVERADGLSVFKRIIINEFGAIPDWPSGFFDQGPNESERILDAASKKKLALRTRVMGRPDA
jgi:predicted ATPase